ncbi:hypothetical protein BC827DRAFT_1086447, partial [Russula dissimulans]
MSVARNIVFNSVLVPGDIAVDMSITVDHVMCAGRVARVEVGTFRAVADALEVISRMLVQNAGGDAV